MNPKSAPQHNIKVASRLVEFLDQGRLKPGLILRDTADRVAVLGADGREKLICATLFWSAIPNATSMRPTSPRCWRK